MIKNAMCILGLAAIVAPAFAAEWVTDLEAAKTQAAQENKDVLIDFTGSDWCGWCIKLRKEIFDTPEFESYAKDKFVLVEIDLPHAPGKLSKEQLQKNRELCEQYQVKGFPTIMVLNPQGAILGGFVGSQPNMEATAKVLDKAIANGKLMEKAAAEQGVERAKTLMEVFTNMPEDFQMVRDSLVKEIQANDPDNTTGVQDMIAEDKQMEEIVSSLAAAGNDFDKMITCIDQALVSALPGNKAKLADLKAQIMIRQALTQLDKAESEEDVKAVKDQLSKAADLQEDKVKEQTKAIINQMFADPAQVLKEIKQARERAIPATKIRPVNQ